MRFRCSKHASGHSGQALLTMFLIAAVCILNPGCAAHSSTSQGDQAVPGEPVFTGPYAADLLNDYRAAPEGFAREAISDGVISDLERAEGRQLFTECLSGIGVTLTRYDDLSGSYDIRSDTQNVWDDFTDTQSQQAQSCYMDSGFGWVDSLFLRMRANPEKADDAELVFACLQKSAALPEGYSRADFEREYASGEGVTLAQPELEHSATGPLRSCENDPLGIVRSTLQQ